MDGVPYSRCPCPAINASEFLPSTESAERRAVLTHFRTVANHGIIPRSGRHIIPIQLSAAVHNTYNLSITLSIQLLAAFYPFYLERCVARLRCMLHE